MDLDRHDFQLDELVERIKSNDNRYTYTNVSYRGDYTICNQVTTNDPSKNIN